MYKNHLVIVFAIDHYKSLGVIRSLGANGIRPIYIAIRHRVELGVKSKYVSKVYQVDGMEEGYQILMEQYGEVYKTGKNNLYCSQMINQLDILISGMKK